MTDEQLMARRKVWVEEATSELLATELEMFTTQPVCIAAAFRLRELQEQVWSLTDMPGDDAAPDGDANGKVVWCPTDGLCPNFDRLTTELAALRKAVAPASPQPAPAASGDWPPVVTVWGVPEGWRLVPVEPTEEMTDAGRRVRGMEKMHGVLAAAISAAPPPPPPPAPVIDDAGVERACAAVHPQNLVYPDAMRAAIAAYLGIPSDGGQE